MKKSIVLTSVIAVMVAFYLTGCSTPGAKVDASKDKVTEVEKELSIAKKEYLADVKKYREEANAQIEQNKKSIDQFKTRISTEKKEARAGYELKIAELEKKNKDMKLKLDQYKGGSAEQWESFKAEFNRDMNTLGDAFRDMTENNVK